MKNVIIIPFWNKINFFDIDIFVNDIRTNTLNLLHCVEEMKKISIFKIFLIRSEC